MGATRYIKDPRTGNTVKVNKEGTMEVVVHPHPPIGETIIALPFAQFFTDNGASDGSNNMIVNGSLANPLRFFIKASADYDIYIGSITVQVSDPGARLDRFGALPALTNGVRFYYESPEIGELVISEAIKTNLDYFRDATDGKDFGDGTGAWKADIAGGGGEDTYFPELDLADRFKLPFGIRLLKGSEAKLIYEVRDNLNGLSVYNTKGYGLII